MNGKAAMAAMWLGLAGVGCGAAQPQPAAPASGPSAASEPAPPATQPQAGEEAEIDRREKMWRHFDDVNEARNAVIAGDLVGIEAPLKRVAAGEWGMEVPEHWNPDLNEMKAVAGRAPRVRSLPEASQLITELAHVCAECHRTNRGGPEVPVDRVGYPDQETSVQDTMARHVWAADELWLGLTAPDVQAWRRGVEAVEGGLFLFPGEDEPVELSDEAKALEEARVAFDRQLGGLRAWAQKASAATRPQQRESLYAELLDECANCHVRLEVKLGRTL